MDILRNLRRLESRLAKKVNETAQKMTPSKPREPLEIVHAIVETVEKHIELPGGEDTSFHSTRFEFASPQIHR